MRLLYFHGFASSPASAKITAIRPMLAPDIELVTPDLNVPSFELLDWNAIVDHVAGLAREQPPDIIAGSSLGALVALSIARRGIVAPMVLIAPALGIADRWRTQLPDGDPILVFNHARKAEVPIHRKFFEQMFEVRVDSEPPPSRVTVIMGRNDESVPFELVHETWQRWVASGRLVDGSKFIEVADGDHGLTANADLIVREIRQTAGQQVADSR
jgi:pimeloyl-ACP methyl ester carboxylesterase